MREKESQMTCIKQRDNWWWNWVCAKMWRMQHSHKDTAGNSTWNSFFDKLWTQFLKTAGFLDSQQWRNSIKQVPHCLMTFKHFCIQPQEQASLVSHHRQYNCAGVTVHFAQPLLCAQPLLWNYSSASQVRKDDDWSIHHQIITILQHCLSNLQVHSWLQNETHSTSSRALLTYCGLQNCHWLTTSSKQRQNNCYSFSHVLSTLLGPQMANITRTNLWCFVSWSIRVHA